MAEQWSYQMKLDCCYAMILVAREDPDTSTDFANRFTRPEDVLQIINQIK